MANPLSLLGDFLLDGRSFCLVVEQDYATIDLRSGPL
jgi:hypothetical protein